MRESGRGGFMTMWLGCLRGKGEACAFCFVLFSLLLLAFIAS